MPNQNNYESSVDNSETRFSVSRVFDGSKDKLLETEVPLGGNDYTDAVELHLYDTESGQLVFTKIIRPDSGALSYRTVVYSDGSKRTFIIIEFAKIVNNPEEAMFFSGFYKAVLNFFSDEIGSYESPILRISRISPSRTEVELEYTDAINTVELDMFASPQINKHWVGDAVSETFNQTGSFNIPTSHGKLTSSSIESLLGPEIVLDMIDLDVDDEVYTLSQNVLNSAYVSATEEINKLISSGSTKFTVDELTRIATRFIQTEYSKLNPTKNFKYTLV